jgi:mono/diheme cytochrome c family protein
MSMINSHFSFVRRGRMVPAALGVVMTLALVVTGCRNDMHDQPRFNTFEANPFYADSQSARPLVANTVARGFLREDKEFYTGRIDGPVPAPSNDSGVATGMEAYVVKSPVPVTRQVLLRGQDRFNVYCSPCHGRTGLGNGMIVQRGMKQPPSYHEQRLRDAPDGYIFDVMTNGFGVMYSYASRVKPEDRWAIVAYIRALQLSFNAPADALSAEQKQNLK